MLSGGLTKINDWWRELKESVLLTCHDDDDDDDIGQVILKAPVHAMKCKLNSDKPFLYLMNDHLGTAGVINNPRFDLMAYQLLMVI